MDSALAYPLLLRYPGLRMGMALSEPHELASVVTKGSPLAAELSRHITRLKESGIYFRLVEKYLGAEAVRAVAAGRRRWEGRGRGPSPTPPSPRRRGRRPGWR